MTDVPAPDGGRLTIGDLAERTGVAVATLRVWEQRHGFPSPVRLASGHRRYDARDVERVRRVRAERERGLTLQAAIDRATAGAEPRDAEPSIFAGLRRRRPDLTPYLLPKRTLIALSHAIEDECCARAERPVLLASFQRERFYRHSEPRWRELARTAQLAAVLADFPAVRRPSGAPIEVPLDRLDPLGREWSLVCDAPDYAACLSAWEPPGQDHVPDRERRLETIWTVEPELVRQALRIAVGIAARRAPDVADRVAATLGDTPLPSREELRLVTALTSRMVAYVGEAEVNGLPAPHSSAEA